MRFWSGACRTSCLPPLPPLVFLAALYRPACKDADILKTLTGKTIMLLSIENANAKIQDKEGVMLAFTPELKKCGHTNNMCPKKNLK